MIYLDHNATTPLRPEARAAMEPFLGGDFGNPSSAHAAGSRARVAVESARRILAAALHVLPSAVFFTSGGTESNNWALFGAAAESRDPHLVVSPIEHSSVIGAASELERRGARVTWLRVDGQGFIDPDDVAAALRPSTVLVTIGWANSEIGTLQPIGQIARICRAHGVRLHVDAVQALGKVPLDLRDVDLCSITAHKIEGPKGIGALVMRKGVGLRPLLFGGSQERGLRPGTENVAGAVAFAEAVRHLAVAADETAELRDLLWRAFERLGGRRHGPREACLPNTLNVGFEGVRGESLVAGLDLEGVCVSVGSACAAGSGEPSHVLRAIGLGEEAARSGVRFSLGRRTNGDEVRMAVAATAVVLDRIRRASSKRAVGE